MRDAISKVLIEEIMKEEDRKFFCYLNGAVAINERIESNTPLEDEEVEPFLNFLKQHKNILYELIEKNLISDRMQEYLLT